MLRRLKEIAEQSEREGSKGGLSCRQAGENVADYQSHPIKTKILRMLTTRECRIRLDWGGGDL